MDDFNKIIEIAEWLALPVTYLILTLLFFLFVVRPFFAYLFSLERIKSEKALAEAKRKKELIDMQVKEGFTEEEGDETVPFNNDATGGLSDSEKMGRLAESDPEKAGDLVKQWLKKEKA